MKKKKWNHSRTLWVNAVGFIIIIASVLASSENAAVLIAAEGSILALINLVLRVLTNQGLEP